MGTGIVSIFGDEISAFGKLMKNERVIPVGFWGGFVFLDCVGLVCRVKS